MIQTPEPDLFDPPRHSPDADVRWLETLLHNLKAWMLAGEILQSISRAATDSQKRWLRDLCNRSGWIVSGQKGYKHLRHSTPEEIHHCLAWKIHQIKEMGRNVVAIRRNAHRIFG